MKSYRCSLKILFLLVYDEMIYVSSEKKKCECTVA